MTCRSIADLVMSVNAVLWLTFGVVLPLMLVVFRDFGILQKRILSNWSVKAMTLDVFWQRIESAIMDYGECDVCPVNEYAKETKTVRMCERVCDCADGLMMLHKKLQEEEWLKVNIGLIAAKKKVRTEFP
jgi:hypothetical protein